MRVCTVVAKGPSAEKAQEFHSKYPEADWVVINDSGLLIPEVDRWRYLFLSDRGCLTMKIGDIYDKADAFVCPEHAIKGDMPEWTEEKVFVTYPEHACEGDLMSLITRITHGGICHHHTLPGALHWLAKHETYDLVRIVGCDGGSKYAHDITPGDSVTFRSLQETQGVDFLDQWKEITVRLCGLLEKVYTTKFEFFGDEQHGH